MPENRSITFNLKTKQSFLEFVKFCRTASFAKKTPKKLSLSLAWMHYKAEHSQAACMNLSSLSLMQHQGKKIIDIVGRLGGASCVLITSMPWLASHAGLCLRRGVQAPGTPCRLPAVVGRTAPARQAGRRWWGWWPPQQELLCGAELAGDERYIVLWKELQQLPPEQRGTEQRDAAH